MERVDLVVAPAWIATVDDGDRVLAGHSVAVRDGMIVALAPHAECRERFAATEVCELPGQLLIPGLVNAHTHAGMALLRGYADDLPLMTWLGEYIWPAESRWVDKEFVRDGTQLAIAEMLAGGTTCFSDMYYFPDIIAAVARNAGVRAMVGLIVLDFQTSWALDPDEYLHKGLQLHDSLRDDPLVRVTLAPHAPYTVSDEPLRRVRVYSDELDVPVHIHVHETAEEITRSHETFGVRPLRRLAHLGLVNPQLVAVHMTQLDERDLEVAAASGLNVVHCPESNLKLASGFCPVARLLDAGVNVALGTDGAASNNDLDMIGEMRTAALLAKGVAGDASAVDVDQVLRMATLNGARALGLAEETGSLVTGKSADMVAVDLRALATQPVHNPVSQLVFAASRDQVSHVWVAGRCLVRERALTTLDATAIGERAEQWRRRMSRH